MNFLTEGFYSLGSKLNKAANKTQEEGKEGVISEQLPELKLNMENSELVSVFSKRKKEWEESEVYAQWQESADENEKYWKGEQKVKPKGDKSRAQIDNVLFESLETYLPQVTRRNPDPMVSLSVREQESNENLVFAKQIQKELGEIADEISLRLKLKKAARHWALYLLGAFTPEWDGEKNIPTIRVVRPHKLILDPKATVDEDGYTGDFFGKHRRLTAGEILDVLKGLGGEPKAKDVILRKIKGIENKATELGFIEWWTKDYMCWIMENDVLLKMRYPHWNYDSEKEAPYTEFGEPQMDENGQIMMETVPGVNHFESRKLPIILLSVFNLGKQPIDDTSLMGQNLAAQDKINKRNEQIDKNADSMNGSIAVSLERSGLTQQQAKGISEAVRRGGTIAIPAGDVSSAIQRLSAPSLPADIYNDLGDTRNRIRDIFGTRGSSAAGLTEERTVRGKLQNRMLDTDRIGGGFSEYLEQMADSAYNWLVQLLYVYDERFAGRPIPKLRVSVKEGSLLPKDSLTLANQALELATQGKMSLVDLYKALDYPNPEELAANAWLEVNAPEIVFQNDPRVQQVVQARQQSQVAPEDTPNVSISFKDLPPDGQAQAAAQAGIQLHPEAIAAYKQAQDRKEFVREVSRKTFI